MRTDRTNMKAAHRVDYRHHRRAVTMVEVISAMAVLATLIVVSAELLTLASAQRRGVVQRSVALVEAENALERLTAKPLDMAQLKEQLAELNLAPHAEQLLPEGRITANTDPNTDTDDLPGYRLTVEVTWQLTSGQRSAPVRLTTWAYPPQTVAATDANTEVEP
jgi:hypothetical protein